MIALSYDSRLSFPSINLSKLALGIVFGIILVMGFVVENQFGKKVKESVGLVSIYSDRAGVIDLPKIKLEKDGLTHVGRILIPKQETRR